MVVTIVSHLTLLGIHCESDGPFRCDVCVFAVCLIICPGARTEHFTVSTRLTRRSRTSTRSIFATRQSSLSSPSPRTRDSSKTASL